MAEQFEQKKTNFINFILSWGEHCQPDCIEHIEKLKTYINQYKTHMYFNMGINAILTGLIKKKENINKHFSCIMFIMYEKDINLEQMLSQDEIKKLYKYLNYFNDVKQLIVDQNNKLTSIDLSDEAKKYIQSNSSTAKALTNEKMKLLIENIKNKKK